MLNLFEIQGVNTDEDLVSLSDPTRFLYVYILGFMNYCSFFIFVE